MDFEDSSSSSSFSPNEVSPSHVPATSSSSCCSASPRVPAKSPKRRAGRKKFRETRHPVYHGVRERNGGKWVCEVREPRKKSRIWLGTCATPEMAARAHDIAAMALRGQAALLNFPDSAWTLPPPASSSAEDIRRAASKAAEMFRPTVSLPAPQAQPAAVFVDEEALFNKPGLLDDMARGLMLTPPAMQKGFDWDGVECQMDLSLWID
ncbi:dehydration-responsive element-binding protein 1F-like [Phoenix dactylifera]|uniref:Dehydration-responsive element-binding protein 1F-like n=1 Tax=Phoenix dactylifera TaxID=42345 RepID=A0A8B7CVU3_PHODC|nr:dehydration-responsive element-binding protein 1F-like [Phoenix dactylifera]